VLVASWATRIRHAAANGTLCLFCSNHAYILIFVSLFRLHSDGVVSNNGPSPEKESGRRRGPPRSRQQPQRADGNGDTDSPRSKRRTSLRIGTTGRKGRGAELSQRRGSLKKRDRRAEKEARAEAAVERKTVELPEYVVT